MAKSQRVMMIAQSMVGGAAEHIRVLGAALVVCGWEVSVVANWRPGYSTVSAAVFEASGIVTHTVYFPSPLVVRTPRLLLEAAKAGRDLSILVEREQPDIVHAHWRSVLPYCLAPGFPPVVFTKHHAGATDFFSNQFYRRIPSRLIAISEELRNEMCRQSHVPSERVRLVNHGVDPAYSLTHRAEKKKLRRDLGVPEEKLVLISVGRLVAQKDHALTLEAVRRLKDLGHDPHLLLLGEGPLRGSLETRLEELNLEGDVTLAGNIVPGPYLDAADIFVLSSIHEGFALAVVEAMMRGLPPVRTRTGGATDQIQSGVHGFLFPPRDVDRLVEALVFLAQDPAARDAMGSAAKERALSRFTCQGMATRTESVYREIML